MRVVVASGIAVALYTAAAFGVLLFAGLHAAVACLIAAAAGVVVALLAGRVAQSTEPPRTEPEPETETDTETLERIEDGGGFAIAESREDRESREIQTALLPRHPPRLRGYQIDVAYKPCGALGGDFYDFIECTDGRLLITIGDVSGKGASGAIIMAMVQTLFRREAREASGPADLLRRVNDGFAGAVGKGTFVTAQAAMLDPNTHRLTLAGAGHHPMLLLNPSERRSTHVSARGTALGLIQGAAFANGLGETAIDIAPGDSLLLYTDGATECVEHLSSGVGESRFLAAAAAAVLAGPAGALDRLGADLFDGVDPRDDTTLLMVSRQSESADHPPSSDRNPKDLAI